MTPVAREILLVARFGCEPDAVKTHLYRNPH